MPPRDIASLLAYLINQRQFQALLNNLLTLWGPSNRPLLGPSFLPPRLVMENEGVIERVRIRTVAAVDGTRYSPAQLADGGQLFGSVRYRLGNSDIARQFTGPDYDALVRYLNTNQSMQAAAMLMNLYDAAIVQALSEHDEIPIWEGIVLNHLTSRGDNGYFEYEDGPDLTGHRVAAGGNWSDATYNPYDDIDAQAQLLVDKGFERTGIRMVTTDRVRRILMSNPFTAKRAGRVLVMGGTMAETFTGSVDINDLNGVFAGLGLGEPVTYDRRISTRTGQVRAYPEGNFTMIAATGRDEEVMYNQDNPADVRIVQDALGFNGIGRPNGRAIAERATEIRAFTNEKNARIEAEGWQTTGPVILEPEAIANISNIQ